MRCQRTPNRPAVGLPGGRPWTPRHTAPPPIGTFPPLHPSPAALRMLPAGPISVFLNLREHQYGLPPRCWLETDEKRGTFPLIDSATGKKLASLFVAIFFSLQYALPMFVVRLIILYLHYLHIHWLLLTELPHSSCFWPHCKSVVIQQQFLSFASRPYRCLF